MTPVERASKEETLLQYKLLLGALLVISKAVAPPLAITNCQAAIEQLTEELDGD